MSDSRLQTNWESWLWREIRSRNKIRYVSNFAVNSDYSRLKNSSVWRQINLFEWDDESNDIHRSIERTWNFRRKRYDVLTKSRLIWVNAECLSLISRNQDHNACIRLDSIKAWQSFVFWSKTIIIRHRIRERY